MNCAAFSDSKHSYLVAGQESHCQLYHVESVLINEEVVENIGHESEVRHRKGKDKVIDKNRNSKKLRFIIKPTDSVQTDFQGSEPLLRVSRIHPSGKVLATGKLHKN